MVSVYGKGLTTKLYRVPLFIVRIKILKNMINNNCLVILRASFGFVEVSVGTSFLSSLIHVFVIPLVVA